MLEYSEVLYYCYLYFLLYILSYTLIILETDKYFLKYYFEFLEVLKCGQTIKNEILFRMACLTKFLPQAFNTAFVLLLS